MKKLLFLIILIFLILATKALASSVYFSVPGDIRIGDVFKVGVIIDTDGKMINSVDIGVIYDEDALSFAGYKDDNSLIKMWIKSPSASEGVVTMMGVIPGGVSESYDPRQSEPSSKMTLIELLFQAEKEGLVEFAFEKSVILQNDGNGSELSHRAENIQAGIKDNPGQAGEGEMADTIPPSELTLQIIESPSSLKPALLVAFEAKDAESGIKKYEIRKGNGKWETAESPVLATRSILPYALTIRAFDFNDNFEEGSVVIPGLFSFEILVLIVVGLLISSILVYKLVSYKK